MPKLKTILKSRLKTAARIAVLGIGSELRTDDAAGMAVAKRLKADAKTNRLRSLKVFLGQTAPENLTGEIKKFKPSHLVIVDAVDFNQKPGTVKVIDTAKEAAVSFSTHRMPLRFMQDYLYKSIGCETIIIGIQPASLEFCGELSAAIRRSVERVSAELLKTIEPAAAET